MQQDSIIPPIIVVIILGFIIYVILAWPYDGATLQSQLPQNHRKQEAKQYKDQEMYTDKDNISTTNTKANYIDNIKSKTKSINQYKPKINIDKYVRDIEGNYNDFVKNYTEKATLKIQTNIPLSYSDEGDISIENENKTKRNNTATKNESLSLRLPRTTKDTHDVCDHDRRGFLAYDDDSASICYCNGNMWLRVSDQTTVCYK